MRRLTRPPLQLGSSLFVTAPPFTLEQVRNSAQRGRFARTIAQNGHNLCLSLAPEETP
jgi:hypothetical protein